MISACEPGEPGMSFVRLMSLDHEPEDGMIMPNAVQGVLR